MLAAATPDPARIIERTSSPGAGVIVELLGLAGDTLESITPSVTLRAFTSDGSDEPVALGVQISLTPTFQQLILDTAVAASATAEIQLTRPLSSGTRLFFRGTARDAAGNTYFSPASAARHVPVWLRLVFPNAAAASTLSDRVPTFRWSSAPVSTPPGPWIYEISIFPSTGESPVFVDVTADTIYQLPVTLEFNASYRWAVIARLADHSSIRAMSRSTFVIASGETPRATLLYPTFPSPFPSEVSQSACIWFDLHMAQSVTLDILDSRSNRVKRIFPTAGGGLLLAAGRYGRAPVGQSGCDPAFSWDGTDERGIRVIPGVYLVRLQAGGRQYYHRMVFRG